MPKETCQSFHKALNMCKACGFLTASLSHPESEETEPSRTETMCSSREGGMKWSRSGGGGWRGVVRKTETEREREKKKGRGTKKLEGRRDWNRDRNRAKKNEEEGTEGPCVLLMSVLWPSLIANKCLDIVGQEHLEYLWPWSTRLENSLRYARTCQNHNPRSGTNLRPLLQNLDYRCVKLSAGVVLSPTHTSSRPADEAAPRTAPTYWISSAFIFIYIPAIIGVFLKWLFNMPSVGIIHIYLFNF